MALGKTRGVPFIPLPYRLAMWSYFPHLAAASVCPPYQEGNIDDLNQFYQQIFDRTGARYCFAHEDDPHKEEKVRRGVYLGDLVIPNYSTESTTDRVFTVLPSPDVDSDFFINLFAIRVMRIGPTPLLDQLPIPEHWSYRKCQKNFLVV